MYVCIPRVINKVYLSITFMAYYYFHLGIYLVHTHLCTVTCIKHVDFSIRSIIFLVRLLPSLCVPIQHRVAIIMSWQKAKLSIFSFIFNNPFTINIAGIGEKTGLCAIQKGIIFLVVDISRGKKEFSVCTYIYIYIYIFLPPYLPLFFGRLSIFFFHFIPSPITHKSLVSHFVKE